jgi:hypothetical protein
MYVRATDIDQEEVKWIKSYAVEVTTVFGGEFDSQAARFKDSKKLLQRFDKAVNSMLSKGRRLVAAVDEAHNELCVASQLLANADPRFTLVEYEPILPRCAKSIDFRARTDQGRTLYVDVKTIKPKPTDRWDHFEKAKKEGWFPENVQVILSKPWLGGELWHNMFTARARMLEYALELEAKIRDCTLVEDDNTFFIIVFCGDGFHWRQDGLEDFVSFYRTGSHRADDPFSKVETKDIADKNITLNRTITRFACMNRSQFAIRHRRLNWNVQPPKAPTF